jgi:putative DNA primase/helicase
MTPRQPAAAGGLLAAALVYASRLGWPVIPLYHVRSDGSCACRDGASCRSAGKHPRIDGWQAITRPELEQVRAWWQRWPQANIGVVLGVGHAVLDIDPRHGGDEALVRLEREHGALPLTPTVLTAGGGAHYHFAAPAGIPTVEIVPGVELKAAGAQVVLPPSRNVAGAYRWDAGAHIADIPLAELPAWLQSLVSDRRRRPLGAPLPQAIIPGQRNRWLASLAGTLRRRGCTELEILECLRALNESRCRPPLPAEELRKIARSISRYEPGVSETSVGASRITVEVL